MPMPTRRKGEKKDDFIDRCMGDENMNEEFPETDQRRAVCEKQWDKKEKAMKIIAISGVIGWDVYAADVRRQLAEAGSEDVEVQIASPGGFVVEGLEIFNLLRRYPGNLTTRLMGMAASLASYVALAGSRVIAEENVVFMIHNAMGFSMGDHNEMRKAADVFEGLSRILAREYERKSGKSNEEVRELMDEETYYFGPEAKEAGFVDEIVPVTAEDAEKDKTAALALAHLRVAEAMKIVKEIEKPEDVTRAVAMLGEIEKTPAVGGKAAKAASKGEEVRAMTLTELQKEHPECYAAAVESGVQKERARMLALEKWIAADAGNAKVAAIVAEAKATGKSEAEVMAQLQVAVRDAKPASDGGDNPPAVTTAAAQNGAGVDPEVQAEIDRMAKPMGVKAEDIRKFGQKGGK